MGYSFLVPLITEHIFIIFFSIVSFSDWRMFSSFSWRSRSLFLLVLSVRHWTTSAYPEVFWGKRTKTAHSIRAVILLFDDDLLFRVVYSFVRVLVLLFGFVSFGIFFCLFVWDDTYLELQCVTVYCNLKILFLSSNGQLKLLDFVWNIVCTYLYVCMPEGLSKWLSFISTLNYSMM